MSWVCFDDVVFGPCVLAADDGTYELFRTEAPLSVRVHRALTHLDVGGPDRRGRIHVRLRVGPRRSPNGIDLTVLPDTWTELLEPLLERFPPLAEEDPPPIPEPEPATPRVP